MILEKRRDIEGILSSVQRTTQGLTRGEHADVVLLGPSIVAESGTHCGYPENTGPGSVIPAVAGSTAFGTRFLPWNGKAIPQTGTYQDILVLRDSMVQPEVLDCTRLYTPTSRIGYPSPGTMVMVMEGPYLFSILRVVSGEEGTPLVLRLPVSNERVTVLKWAPVKFGSVVTVRTNFEAPQYGTSENTLIEEDPVMAHDAEAVAAALSVEEIDSIKRRAEAEKERADQAEVALERMWEALESKAKDLGWCSDYDDFAEENGGPAREGSWTVVADMELEIGDLTLDRILGDELNDQGDAPDVRGSVNINHRAEVKIEGRFGSDGPSEEAIEAALKSNGWKFDSFEMYESYRD